jgi:hypothetical protein
MRALKGLHARLGILPWFEEARILTYSWRAGKRKMGNLRELKENSEKLLEIVIAQRIREAATPESAEQSALGGTPKRSAPKTSRRGFTGFGVHHERAH